MTIAVLLDICRRWALAALLFSAGASLATAQRPPAQLDSAEILHRMHKLDVLGSVLYIAAHPDDENTRLISYLSNGRKLRTAYLSLTRGDGGQNLIGAELGDALGILRTQELLEARRIDGGEQYFTRAVDFGYSKNSEETFAKWGREQVLADVVRVVRDFRPDVIITRFAPDGSGGHGHHTASSVLANEAFKLAADPKAFPEQLAQGLEPWQAKRLYFNASTWWRSDLAEVVKTDPGNWVSVDVGGFDALLGASYTEIAGRSRSQHKSQGFGAAETRGEQIEYLRLDQGPKLSGADLLDGVALGWERIGAEQVGALVDAMTADYDPHAPEKSIDQLAQLARALDALAASPGPERNWARRKAQDARQLILQCAGAVVEATSNAARVAAGDTVAVELTSMQRSAQPTLRVAGFSGPDKLSVAVDEQLPRNRALTKNFDCAIASAQEIDQPYWLAAPHGALFEPDLSRYAGIEPDSRASALFYGSLRLADGLEISAPRSLMRKWVDRVAGERTRPVVVTPVASIEVGEAVAIVRGERVRVSVELEALIDELSGVLELEVPQGWSVETRPQPVSKLRRGERQALHAELRRTPTAVAGELQYRFVGDKGTTDRTLHVIDYPHILPQTWYTSAQTRLVPLNVEVSSKIVGYIDGAGDDLPRALQRLGVSVEHIDVHNSGATELAKFDAIVVGIRAYNTVPALANFNSQLLSFVEQGGTLLVQYNTSGGDLVMDARRLGPYPFSLTRDRVTVEEAAPTFLLPEHALLSTPNRLNAVDFEGWVQERGLYFTGNFAPQYSALIAWNDPGEKALDGGLIACDFGKGRYIYTGISLFRQLPAGVPGAYRLLANLIARRSVRE
jgi:LmbE family N-acetylglucosaminyl deacetylase